MRKHSKLFLVITVILVLTSILSYNVFARCVNPDIGWLSDTLETELSAKNTSYGSHIIGIETFCVGGSLAQYLEDGDVIISVGKTLFSDCDDVWGCFRYEVEKSISGNSPLEIVVKDINSGKFYKFRVGL